MCFVPPPVAEERREVQEGAFGCGPFLIGQRPTVAVLQRRARRQFQDAQFGLVPGLSQVALYLLRGNGEAKSVNGSAAVEEISEARTRGPQARREKPEPESPDAYQRSLSLSRAPRRGAAVGGRFDGSEGIEYRPEARTIGVQFIVRGKVRVKVRAGVVDTAIGLPRGKTGCIRFSASVSASVSARRSGKRKGARCRTRRDLRAKAA